MRYGWITGLALAISLAASAGEDLENAARSAMEACRIIGASGIDECSNSTGKSPEHSRARKAVAQLYNARARFMTSCDGPQTLHQCQDESDWLILAGLSSPKSKP